MINKDCIHLDVCKYVNKGNEFGCVHDCSYYESGNEPEMVFITLNEYKELIKDQVLYKEVSKSQSFSVRYEGC